MSVEEIDKEVDSVIQKLRKIDGLAEANLFRVLYYDCAPFEGKQKNVDGQLVDFSTKPIVPLKKQFLKSLSQKDRYALRLGQLSFRGWKSAQKGSTIPIFQQKGVDMKCGLDIAVMSMKKIVDLIVIIAGDSDFIAPLKAARKEGVLVAVYHMGLPIKDELKKHCDFLLS